VERTVGARAARKRAREAVVCIFVGGGGFLEGWYGLEWRSGWDLIGIMRVMRAISINEGLFGEMLGAWGWMCKDLEWAWPSLMNAWMMTEQKDCFGPGWST